MDSKGRLVGFAAAVSVFFLIWPSSIQEAVANHLPAERSSCHLSPCRTKNPSPTCCLRFKSAVRSRCGCRFPTGGTFLTVEQARSLGYACKLTPEALGGGCFDVPRVMKAGAKSSKQKSTASTDSQKTKRMTNSRWISTSSRRLLQTDSSCSECREGSIDDPESLVPHPPKIP